MHLVAGLGLAILGCPPARERLELQPARGVGHTGRRLALGAGVAATARDDERAVLLVAALVVLLADEPAGRAARLEGAPEPGAEEREGEA